MREAEGAVRGRPPTAVLRFRPPLRSRCAVARAGISRRATLTRRRAHCGAVGWNALLTRQEGLGVTVEVDREGRVDGKGILVARADQQRARGVARAQRPGSGGQGVVRSRDNSIDVDSSLYASIAQW